MVIEIVMVLDPGILTAVGFDSWIEKEPLYFLILF
jgi:hypothetical protein